MPTGRSERGFVSFSGIFSLLVLAAIVFLAIKLVPPYFSNYQLQDTIQNLALSASYSPVTAEDIQKTVISNANSYGIILPPKQVVVRKEGNAVEITVHYVVPVDLLVRQVELRFDPSATNHSIVGASR